MRFVSFSLAKSELFFSFYNIVKWVFASFRGRKITNFNSAERVHVGQKFDYVVYVLSHAFAGVCVQRWSARQLVIVSKVLLHSRCHQ